MSNDKTYLVYRITYKMAGFTNQSIRRFYYDDNILENYSFEPSPKNEKNIFPIYSRMPSSNDTGTNYMYVIELPSSVKTNTGNDLHYFNLIPSIGVLAPTSSKVFDDGEFASVALNHTNTTNIKIIPMIDGVFLGIPLYDKDVSHHQLSNLI